MQIDEVKHILVVEAYEGCLEFLSDDPEDWKITRGLGLPLEEIAEALDCRMTVLTWDEWPPHEDGAMWVPVPATRPVHSRDAWVPSRAPKYGRVRRLPILPRDPEHGRLFREEGPSPRSYGLINDSGLFFFLSVCLRKELEALHAEDPFDLVILPMWGGIGYVSQMAGATRVPGALPVPFAVVVTDTSAGRQLANQEGFWTRHAIIRRQMEDVSLALADAALVFGERGERVALSGRLPEVSPPQFIPRFVNKDVLEQIARASESTAEIGGALQFFLYEPQQACAGVLAALDGVSMAVRRGLRLSRPFVSAGPSMVFAPMRPRSFEDYWSSRGFVQELKRQGQWEWRRECPQRDGVFPIRFYPSLFDHLPAVWNELARGSLVVLSPAAAEGVAPGQSLPKEILLPGEPEAPMVADHLLKLAALDLSTLDRIRRELCTAVVASHRGAARGRMLAEALHRLRQLLDVPPPLVDLSRVSLMFRDRRVPLRVHAEEDRPPSTVAERSDLRKGCLSVVVTCHEIGPMVRESVESVWASARPPEEVLLIDDGSLGEETLETLRNLQADAAQKKLPLTVLRQPNQGLASARNTGLHAATGEFISFLDGDDLMEPLFYPIALRLLQEYPRLGGVAAWAFIFGEGCPPGFWNAPQTELPLLFSENSVVVPCMMRTEVLRHLGGYDVRQRYNYEDWELSLRLLASGWPLVTVPLQLMHYRVRPDSLYRAMTSIQNQVMRELMLSSHRETVSRFSVEITMQMENRLMERDYPAPDPRRGQPPRRPGILMRFSRVARGLSRRLFQIQTG